MARAGRLAVCCGVVWLAVAACSAAADAPSFDKLFAEWREELLALRRLQVQHRTADDETRQNIEEQYQRQVARAEAHYQELLGAAEVQFLAQPASDSPASLFLQQLLIDRFTSGDYETSLRLAAALASRGVEYRTFLSIGGVSAAALCRFEEAERFFRRSADAAEIDTAGNEPLAKFAEEVHNLAQARRGDMRWARKAWQREQKLRAAEARADDLPRVLLRTTQGDITLELFENEAPGTVANFIHLVERGFYNNLTFHRVVPGYAVETGCPKGDGTGGPGYAIRDESGAKKRRSHFRGSLSMTKLRPGNVIGSQFDIVLCPAPQLEGEQTVFGRVLEGIDVVSRLERRAPGSRDAVPAEKILEARVLRKRDHDYQPVLAP